MATSDWDGVRQGFTKLREECALNPPIESANPPIAWAGRLTAIWIAKPVPGLWRLNYHGGTDGLGVAKRFKWNVFEAAALLGFQGDENGALSFWLGLIKADAPRTHVKTITVPVNQPEQPAKENIEILGNYSVWRRDEIYSIEVLDICGLSADYCRKCKGKAIQSDLRGEKTSSAPPASAEGIASVAEFGKVQAQTQESRAAAHPETIVSKSKGGRRGPKPDLEVALRTAGIVRHIAPGGNWRSKLDEVVKALDIEKIPISKNWKRCTSWADQVDDLVVKVIAYRLGRADQQ